MCSCDAILYNFHIFLSREVEYSNAVNGDIVPWHRLGGCAQRFPPHTHTWEGLHSSFKSRMCMHPLNGKGEYIKGETANEPSGGLSFQQFKGLLLEMLNTSSLSGLLFVI